MSKIRPRVSPTKSRASALSSLRTIPLARAWYQRVFKNFYTYRGRRIDMKRWSVKIQHQRVRRTFTLTAQNRASAAVEAQGIYQAIITHGWEAVTPPAPRRRGSFPTGGGAEADLPKTDIRFWKRRLLRRQ